MRHAFILLIASGFLVTGLTPTAMADATTKVNGIEISEQMIDLFASNRARKPAAEITPEERTALTEELIKLVAVGAEARKQKLQDDPEISAQLALQELSLLAQSYIQRQLTASPVSQAQLTALYDEKYGGGSNTEYKARHILVSSPSVATDIISQLDGGADFVDLAAKNSIGPSAKSGGDLGWFTKESMVPQFANAVATMASGAYSSKPVQTQFGWHVILKEEERALPAPELASVSAELERQLQQQAVTDLVDGLRAKAKVKTSK